MDSSISDPRQARRVFYDGGCPVCRAEIALYSSWRGAERIDWVDIDANDVPSGMDREAMMKRFTIERADGVMVTGAESIIAIWRGLTATRLLGRACDNPPMRWLLERLYRGFLRLRRLWRPARRQAA